MYIEIKLSKIHPNPFRDLGTYPLIPKKLEALRESITATGWWENLVCREHPDKPGEVQLAYGHHRLAVLQQEFDNDKKIGLIKQDLDETAMWKVMARENMDVYHSLALVDVETVKTWLRGVADGVIVPPEVSPDTPKTQIRCAPSAVQGNLLALREHVYTSDGLAASAGWSCDKAQRVLTLVEGLEYGVIGPERLEGRGTRHAADLLSSLITAYRTNHRRVETAKTNGSKNDDAPDSTIGHEEIEASKQKMSDIKKAAGRAVDRTPVDAGHRDAVKESQRAKREIRGAELARDKTKKATRDWSSVIKNANSAVDRAAEWVERIEPVLTVVANQRSQIIHDEHATKLLNQVLRPRISGLVGVLEDWLERFEDEPRQYSDDVIDADYFEAVETIEGALPPVC